MNSYFIKHDVTHAFITTQVGKLFMENIEDTSLKILLVAGEKLGEVENPENYVLIDGFGPTEAFAFVTSIKNIDKIDSSSIGFLNNNSKAYILDNEGRRVPIGAVGELYLAGNQIAEGYLNREIETDKAFLDNSFDNNGDYNMMYRTGDMVRMLPDGSLGFVGRRDSQVKIRGNRVELGEIESVIRNMDDVEDVTVQTVFNNDNNELVAYIVLSDDFDSNNLWDHVCDYVSERKPDYMVPSYVVRLDSIPLNVNGKVDINALPKVDIGSLQAEYAPPSNEVEGDIVEAFERVFNQEKISIHDDFIHLGGDSLTAIRLLSYLDDYDITAMDVLSLHTPQAIAKNIKKISHDLALYSLESGCPLNESQLNVYLDIVANNKKDAYIIPLTMEISEEYDVDDIIYSLDKILNAHPILEMCVSDEFEVPYLVKGSKPLIDVRSDVDDDFIIKFYTAPFDLHDSLCRFLIVENNDGYELFAAFSHIIFDGLSNIIFKQDLQYILEGKSIEEDVSFLKVSAFSKQIQDSEEFIEANDFYECMLADGDEVNSLLENALADGPGIIQVDLDLDINLLRSFLDKYGISENILFTSVFAYTLSRFVGGEKVLFNIIENGRDRFNNFNSIGMFVNTLPLLVDCKNQDISSFMDYMSDLIYSVMKYNYYPFRLLVNKYNIHSNIMFQFLPDSFENNNLNQVESVKRNDYNLIEDAEDLISDFASEVIQKGRNYSLRISYSGNYSRDFIVGFAESYRLILNEIQTVSKLSDINYVSEEDIGWMDSYNQTEHSLPYNDIMDAFNNNLAKHPNNKLVSMGDKFYSYGECAYVANKIAEKLIELGVNSNDCVAFITPRCEYYMFSVLAILSIGGISIPLDDDLPNERLEFILKDSEAQVVIVSDETYDRANALTKDNAVLLNISDIVNDKIDNLYHLPVVYNDLLCIVYTSGTTGIPKGVKITRKAILNLSQHYVSKFKFTKDDVYGLYSTIGFDAGIQAICQSFYAGACLSIIPANMRLDMNKLNEYMVKQGITHTMLTTQVGRLFVQSINDTSLDFLTIGGETLGEFTNTSNCQLIEAYGPTETFAYVTSIKNEDRIDSSSVGAINFNTKFYILDNELRRIPVGAIGELFISSYQIAEGYLNRDEETKKSFIANPFDDGDYDKLYRTGDLVRFLPDGTLGIIGRRDSQVKIRGNRVELSEVESVIRELKCIEDVTVQTIENQLVAYVVESCKIDNLEEYVCNHVANHKPEYMVPSFVIKLENIPLTVNGKVDTHALPKVDLSSLNVEYVAPTNETENVIVESFENVFNREKIGIYDDFIKLGGDSLTAIKLLSILSNKGIKVNANVIFDIKTPYGISRYVAETKNKYSFNLIKKGSRNQNMFFLPPRGGLSLAFSTLIDAIDFEGNIYVIDDYKYNLSLEELKNETDPYNTLNHYYDAIKDLFNDGDILVGYSLGAIYVTLIAEKLEKENKLAKCILIDGLLINRIPNDFSREVARNHILNGDIFNKSYLSRLTKDKAFLDKVVEIVYLNTVGKFHKPNVKSQIIYLATNEGRKVDLDKISDF